MKTYHKIIIVLILILIFIYTCNITLLPNTVILMQGEILDINTAYGITVGKTRRKTI